MIGRRRLALPAAQADPWGYGAFCAFLLPSLIGSAVLSAISVAMMTWIVLPVLTWLFRGWLYPKNAKL